MTIPPLSIILMILITALLVGHFIGTFTTENDMNRLLEQIDTTEALDRTLLSQMRLDTAQSNENERTMFQYLDNAINATRDNTKAIENIINSLQLQTKEIRNR